MISVELIRERVAAAGIVGAGGAGFPTSVKLAASADIYLVNCAECEPMLKVDQQLAARDAATLLRGLRYGMIATGAKEGIIALKAKYHEAIAALTPLLPEDVRLHVLEDIYPAGDEVITIWLATGRRVPPAALPLDVGVVVNNVQTLINVAMAVDEELPVTQRTLTVNGMVQRPVTVTVPLGTPLREVLALAGGTTRDEVAFIDGGPMMGKLLASLDNPVTKTTGGLLVLPRDHLLIRRRTRSDNAHMRVARTVCEQCGLCTELCPRHLIGHELPPHLIVRAVNYRHAGPTPDTVLAALTCSECGVCEAYACPVDISPLHLHRMLKQELRAKGLRYQGELREVDPMARQRLVPVSRLITRLGLDLFNHKAPFEQTQYLPQEVKLLLRQHIGVAAIPCVTVGERVGKGQLIATVPENKLGAQLHASVEGIIAALDDTAITIKRMDNRCSTMPLP